MEEPVMFASEEEYREKAQEVFGKHFKFIKSNLPESQVYHVGSTAVEGSLTKGDVDIQIRVTQEAFSQARAFLMEHYDINKGSDQTSFFCAFEKEDEILPLGIQLTVKSSVVDNFWKVTQYFKENPEYIDLYNQLKRKYQGKDMDDYRKEKADFIEGILSSADYKRVSDRLDLYGRVKIVKGKNFVTIEDTKELTTEEFLDLISHVLSDPSFKKMGNLNILVSDKFPQEVEQYLMDKGLQLHDEIVKVFHSLSDKSHNKKSSFTFKSLNELSIEEFKRIWAHSMNVSLNSPSSLNIDEQMKSVKFELGQSYKDSCLVVYEGEFPIGVAMPHIEPGTQEEGRLFYFGLIPSQ
ncbi:GrpB family protein [Tuberibacillus sp. Marseille-P3662]|uniref:GrpB family protein n=1 Tax=Tuberibacillus sp. Marseille-P3662 TaxID=1965358 RepID=UPI000A1C92AB|nr:GrpB family protein [Tuberibacillus sp. Marseille-P3662]